MSLVPVGSAESESSSARSSNFRPDKNVTKKSDLIGERISFSSLVALAAPGDKPEVWLAERTGKNERTARRWLAKRHRRPEIALAVVMGEILRRLD